MRTTNGANGALVRLTSRLTFLMDEAQRRGIAGSATGGGGRRVRPYESEWPMGKDHYNGGGSYMIILPPGTGLGDRVVGYTGPRHEQRTINPTTGAPDPNGVVINPKHVHKAIHEYLGFQSTAPGGLGVPAAEKLKLFSPTCHTGHPNLSLININATTRRRRLTVARRVLVYCAFSLFAATSARCGPTRLRQRGWRRCAAVSAVHRRCDFAAVVPD